MYSDISQHIITFLVDFKYKMEEFAITPQLKERLTQKVNFGHRIGKPKLGPSSSVFLPEVDLKIYVIINENKTKEMVVSSESTVWQLVQMIRQDLQGEERPCLMYNQEVLYYHDKLKDWDVRDEGIIRVLGKKYTNFTLTIKLMEVKKSIAEINADHMMKVDAIKHKISDEHLGLQPADFKLFLGGDEMQNQKSLSDFGIFTNCTLLLKYSKPKGIEGQTKIKLMDYSNVQINHITPYDQILCLNFPENEKIHNKYQILQKNHIEDPCKVILVDNTQIICSRGMYFLRNDLKWVGCTDNEEDRLQIGNKIMTVSGQFVEVENTHYYFPHSFVNVTKLYYMLINKNRPYYANGMLVTPGLEVQVLYRRQKTHLLSFDLHPSMTIAKLKERINRQLSIAPSKQHLFIQNRQIMLKDDTPILQIYEQNMIVQLSEFENGFKSVIQVEKMVIIQFDKEKKSINYNQIIGMTCNDIVIYKFPEKVKEFPYFGVLFEKKIIERDTNIEDIIPKQSQAFYYQTFTIVAIKFPERFKIGRMIEEFKPQKKVENYTSKIKGFFSSLLFTNNRQEDVLSRYKSNYLMREVKEVLDNLHNLKLSENQLIQKYRYISQLIHFLLDKPHYYKKCHRALLDFKFSSQQFVQNSIINIREFLTCLPNKQQVEQLAGAQDTILHIKSISGRRVEHDNISQVVFFPYTYFIINKVTRQDNIMHIELQQMPMSLGFDRNLVIWVDDNPKNNEEYINKYRKIDTQVIQLTSTAMARRWFDQFRWIVNRMDLDLRIITDMVRLQQIREEANKEKYKQNYEAGIDLIEYLFNQRGFTTPVLVFCNDFQKGRQNIANRKIRSDRFHMVTNKFQDLCQYMAFQTNVKTTKTNKTPKNTPA